MTMAIRRGADNGPRDTKKAAVRVLTAPTEPQEKTGIEKDLARRSGIHGLIGHPAVDLHGSTE